MISFLSYFIFFASVVWLLLVIIEDSRLKEDRLVTSAYIISVSGLLIAIYLRMVA